MARRAAPHRGIDIHYGDSDDAGQGDAAERPSKTQLKQKSHDLQSLGVQVAALSDERLAKLDMPEALRDAIEDFRKTKSHEGRRRQMQYVGKLMRSADEDVLREAVAEAELGSAKDTLLLHQAEDWRDQLIADDDAMTRWLQQYPDTDTQQLRSLVRAARRDAALPSEQKRQSRNYRDLFQFIKPLIVIA